MAGHDRMKNTPQMNGEETWMENELLQSKLKQKFILLMKIREIYAFYNLVKCFVEIIFSFGKKHIVSDK